MGILHGTRLALRNLLKTPGHTLAAVTTVTLVIAAGRASLIATAHP
jgi:hypothetical protein